MKGRYIIFADDDADDLELITGFFKQYNRNIHVLEFKDGKEVLKFLEDFAHNASKPILIVLDINMPRMNGRETLASLRANPRYKNIPIVVYTTSSNQMDESYCRNLGASWLNKPHSVDGVKKAAKILAEFCQVVS
jgi:CheY-like chemotaxis protein